MLNHNTYFDVDEGLQSYYFEFDFPAPPYDELGKSRACLGNRMNEREDIILLEGRRIMKETFIECETVMNFLDYGEQVSEDNILIDRIRFSVDGNTVLHYFALNTEILSMVLEYFEEHKVEYLSGILMKNVKGESPLEITIKNESPKNTELLLRKLTWDKDKSFSRLFYHRFYDLLEMNLTAFHEYLDECYFSTMIMENIKYLKLKKTGKDVYLYTHSSCMIDDEFKRKHCVMTKKERERQKALMKQEALERKKKLEEEKK